MAFFFQNLLTLQPWKHSPCFGHTGFLEGVVYALVAEPLSKFSGLTKVHSGFGKIPNSWCYGPQI